MATGASLLTHRHMLKGKRSRRLGVAAGAHGELPRGRSELTPDKRSVGVVAVAALDKSDLHAMTIRAVELSFLRSMAAKAKNSLFALEQGPGFGGMMR